MTRGMKVFLVLLIVGITLFSMSTGFFYAQSKDLQKKVDADKKSTDTAAATISSPPTEVAPTTTPASTDTTTTAVATSSTDSRPSSPSDTVVVQSGETLFQIGQKAGVSYLLIAEANGIEADKIKVGQTLIIPKNNQISYTINKDKATALQKDVVNGKYAFRLSALDTAKADAPTTYGLLGTDSFVLGKSDPTSSSATVTVAKNDKTYLISLVQPATKGDKGIWAIESIKPQAK